MNVHRITAIRINTPVYKKNTVRKSVCGWTIPTSSSWTTLLMCIREDVCAVPCVLPDKQTHNVLTIIRCYTKGVSHYIHQEIGICVLSPCWRNPYYSYIYHMSTGTECVIPGDALRLPFLKERSRPALIFSVSFFHLIAMYAVSIPPSMSTLCIRFASCNNSKPLQIWYKMIC